MALQTDRLVMGGLGIEHDTPALSIQPAALRDGIHLRWSFKRELGFPWYGFYLFRRMSRETALQSFSEYLGGFASGTLPDTTLVTNFGTLRSDTPLTLTTKFADPGKVDISLGGRAYVKLDLAADKLAYHVQLKFGFQNQGSTVRVTGLFSGGPVAQASAVGNAGSTTTLTIRADAISSILFEANEGHLIDVSIMAVAANATGGWQTIPNCPAIFHLPLTHPQYPCTPAMSESFTTARTTARSRIVYGSPDTFAPTNVQSLALSGTVEVKAGSPIVFGQGTQWDRSLEGATLSVSTSAGVYTISRVLPAQQKIILSRPYAGAAGSGLKYKVANDPFGALYDAAAVLVTGGPNAGAMSSRATPAVIASSGTVDVFQDALKVNGNGTAWDSTLEGLALQVGFPVVGTVSVQHNGYKVFGNNTFWSKSLRGGLITINGDPTPYRIRRVDSPTKLTLERRYAGPDSANKGYAITDAKLYTIESVASPSELRLDRPYTSSSRTGMIYQIVAPLEAADGQKASPLLGAQYPLDLMLLAATHPAVAQMLHLYWIDESAVSGTTYDYLIVADYKGTYATAAGLAPGSSVDPNAMLSQIRTNGFGDVEAYIVFGRQRQPAMPLSPPEYMAAYALPDTAAWADAGATGSSVGLRWDLGQTESNILLPDRPIAYHLWRADLGVKPPDAPPASADFTLITQGVGSDGKTLEPRPLMVSDTQLDPGETPQRPENWPPFALHTIDSHLADGWYSYCVSAINIYGQYSALSIPAEWHQWGDPAPTPRPWYYQDPAGTAVVHPFAIAALDKVAPPRPSGVEAYALDPADDYLVRDAAYMAWFATLTPEEQASLVGLRVRWSWGSGAMLQAPDTHEFRIYYNAGSALPSPDYSQSSVWEQRVFVVDFADHVTLTTDADGNPLRVYEVFLPPAGSADRTGAPLTPSLAQPTVYANIGVSAVDDKQHTADDAKWSASPWGGRPGNEGPVGAAKIYRVLRQEPAAPPTPPSDSDRVYATPADYHGRSFYTYRWLPAAYLKTHILRALDETVFHVDLEQRPRSLVQAANTAIFPPEFSSQKRQVVADELNQLNSTLSAILSSNAADKTAQALAAYRALTNDGLRVLAGLPGNEAAFIQLTVKALDPADPATHDRRNLDDPASYQPQAGLRCYLDTLDGKAENRYLYRAAYVDGAQNQSKLSLATPPVWLPDSIPPQAPVLTSALGGDQSITLRWRSNQEADLAEYRIYRAETPEQAEHIRLMSLIASVPEPAAPDARPAEIVWTDTPVQGLVTRTYRLVAVDAASNPSPPSAAVSARAHDEALPVPPALNTSSSGTTVTASWSDQQLEARLQRQSTTTLLWENVTDWLQPGAHSIDDTIDVQSTTTVNYRLRVRKATGAIAVSAPIDVTVTP